MRLTRRTNRALGKGRLQQPADTVQVYVVVIAQSIACSSQVEQLFLKTSLFTLESTQVLFDPVVRRSSARAGPVPGEDRRTRSIRMCGHLRKKSEYAHALLGPHWLRRSRSRPEAIKVVVQGRCRLFWGLLSPVLRAG